VTCGDSEAKKGDLLIEVPGAETNQVQRLVEVKEGRFITEDGTPAREPITPEDFWDKFFGSWEFARKQSAHMAVNWTSNDWKLRFKKLNFAVDGKVAWDPNNPRVGVGPIVSLISKNLRSLTDARRQFNKDKLPSYPESLTVHFPDGLAIHWELMPADPLRPNAHPAHAPAKLLGKK